MSNCFRVILGSIFFALLFAGCALDASSSGTKDTDDNMTEFTKTIPPAEFLAKYKETPGATMVDVRTKKEYFGGKMVPEAINIDYHGDKFLEDIVAQDRDTPIFIYCFSGGRSSKAAYKMRQLGYDRIYECKGGYQAWEKERSNFSKQ